MTAQRPAGAQTRPSESPRPTGPASAALRGSQGDFHSRVVRLGDQVDAAAHWAVTAAAVLTAVALAVAAASHLFTLTFGVLT